MAQRILIVDDEREIRELQAEYLLARGYEVATAASGAEALRLLQDRSASFDLAIVDWQMSGIHGRAVIDVIRRDASHIKVLISTGKAPEEVSDQTARRLAGGMLRKPFSLRSLATEVERLAAQ